jgi:hypothetical protein
MLLQARVAIANGDLAGRLAYQLPIQPGQSPHFAFRACPALSAYRMTLGS